VNSHCINIVSLFELLLSKLFYSRHDILTHLIAIIRAILKILCNTSVSLWPVSVNPFIVKVIWFWNKKIKRKNEVIIWSHCFKSTEYSILPFELGIMSGFFSSESFTSTRYSVLVTFKGGLCRLSVRNLRARTTPRATTSKPQTTPTQTPRTGVSSKSVWEAT